MQFCHWTQVFDFDWTALAHVQCSLVSNKYYGSVHIRDSHKHSTSWQCFSHVGAFFKFSVLHVFMHYWWYIDTLFIESIYVLISLLSCSWHDIMASSCPWGTSNPRGPLMLFKQTSQRINPEVHSHGIWGPSGFWSTCFSVVCVLPSYSLGTH